MTGARRRGILFLVSAPSGAGKSTLRDNLRKGEDFHYSVSCTTRQPRQGEVDHVDYHFLTPETFQKQREAGDFLECAEVHGNSYGTLKSEVLSHLRNGCDLLLDIDVQGARNIRNNGDPEILSALVDVFLMPPEIEELRRRLSGRGTDSGEVVELRIQNARAEMQAWTEYRYVIVSGSREQDLERFRSIMTAERCAAKRWLVTDPIPGEKS